MIIFFRSQKSHFSSQRIFYFKGFVMDNFVCQLAWAMVPKYLVKHYFRCLCQVFLNDFNIYIEGSKLPSVLRVGLTQPTEGLNRERLTPHEEEGALQADRLGTSAPASTFPWVSSLQAYPADVGFVSLPM